MSSGFNLIFPFAIPVISDLKVNPEKKAQDIENNIFSKLHGTEIALDEMSVPVRTQLIEEERVLRVLS